MVNDALPLTLSYDSFARLWKALVSRRKARKLQVDTEQAWEQLRADGDAAQFLQAAMARKEAKKNKSPPEREVLADEKPRTAKQKKSSPSAVASKTKAAKKRKSVSGGRAPASSKRGAKRARATTSGKARRRATAR